MFGEHANICSSLIHVSRPNPAVKTFFATNVRGELKGTHQRNLYAQVAKLTLKQCHVHLGQEKGDMKPWNIRVCC
jgi:hypothetical protein